MGQYIITWNIYSDANCCLQFMYMYQPYSITNKKLYVCDVKTRLICHACLQCNNNLVIIIKLHVYYVSTAAFINTCHLVIFLSSSFLMSFWKYMVIFTFISNNSAVHYYQKYITVDPPPPNMTRQELQSSIRDFIQEYCILDKKIRRKRQT